MPFDWRELLVLAHGLRNEPGEGPQRASLSRAYYYVYNLGLNNARSLGFTGQLPGLHKKLRDWHLSHADPTMKQMGLDGQRMHAQRIDADYKATTIPGLGTEVRKQLSRAQAFETRAAQSIGLTPPSPLPL